MLNKLFNFHKLTSFSRSVPRKPAASAAPTQPKTSSVLRIVHAGGRVEFFYMATPAIKILEKHPSFILARPEVFRRPWDSVVRPDETLTPGEKFFLVPRQTVKKLRRRISRPDREASLNSSLSNFSIVNVSCKQDEFSCKSFCQQSEVSDSLSNGYRKKTSTRKHVTFVGIEVKNKAGASHKEENNNKVEGNKPPKKSFNSESHERRRARNAFLTWQPSLAAINERTDE